MKKLKLQNYTAFFERDPESKWYVVTVPTLPGCISQGRTFEEAARNIKEATELYLESISVRERKMIDKYNSEIIIAPISVSA